MVPNLLDRVVESEAVLAVIAESVGANTLLLTVMMFSDLL
jgi:hypothetical protein